MAVATEQAPSPITYVEGDATAPIGEGLKIVTHCNNNVGAWGAGFVIALSKRWSRPEAEYRRWYEQHGDLKFRTLLGAVQLGPVEEDLNGAHIVGQAGIGRGVDGVPPIRYEALSRGLGFVAQFAIDHPEKRVSVHAPRLGCGLAGASWSKIEPLLMEHFVSRDIPVTIYDFPGGRFNP